MTDKKITKKERDGTDAELRPYNGLATMLDQFFRPFDGFFPALFPSEPGSPSKLETLRQPILDLQDRGDHFSLTAELPGFTKDEVEVRADGNSLELRADKSETADKGDRGEYRRSSRSYYQYLSLPGEVTAEKIDGTMKNGVLELKIPKRSSKLKANAFRVDLK